METLMHKQKYIPIFLSLCGLAILVTATLWLSASRASAQCGSQASSCKNCHEIQGQDPVNNDGNGWHQSHAFGDFCYLCHAGNNQSMVKDEAHTGMVDPLSDVQAACQACHPNDLMERAQVYATALGVEVGSGGSSGGSDSSDGSSSSDSSSSDTASAATAAPSDQASQSPAPVVVASDEDIIDYNQRYEETVLGKRTINWGDAILWVLVVVVALGGGAFVYWNERRLRGLPLISRPAAPAPAAEVPTMEGYTSEVTALLPLIAKLNPVGLHALKRLLQNPDEASELLHSLSQLDPNLVRRIRSLDRETRNLLLALAGD